MYSPARSEGAAENIQADSCLQFFLGRLIFLNLIWFVIWQNNEDKVSEVKLLIIRQKERKKIDFGSIRWSVGRQMKITL